MISWIDMPVATSTPLLSMSYSAQINSIPILTVYSETFGSGLVSTTTVGIGTTTPAWALQIGRATSSVKSFLALSDTLAGTNLKHWTLSSQGGNLYIATSSDIYTTSTVSRLTLLSNGMLGIGTSSPSQQLSISGNTYLTGGLGVGRATTSAGVIETTGIINVQGSGTSSFTNGIVLANGCFFMPSGLCAGSAGSGGAVNTGTANRLAYYSGIGTIDSANFLTVDATNLRLGLATATPATTFSVAGNTYLDSNIITIASSSAATTTVVLGNGLNFDSNTFVIDPNSNRVGIGTANPSAMLEINGNIKGQGYGWFEISYNSNVNGAI